MPLQEQFQQLLSSLLQLVLVLFNPVIIIPAIIIIVVLVKKNRDYKIGAYYQITKLPYHSVKHNTGRYGEYLTYKCLKNFEVNGAKFLFNVYIPKGDGATTEIDILMICSKGVFVFESKNYSGWIFGSEDKKNWYQTLPTGRSKSRKEQFYNPIMQNRSHILHLKTFLGEQVPMRSIIVFSERCTLKNIQVKSNDIRVINRNNVASVVSAVCSQIPTDLLSESDITNLYNKLYPYTQVDAIAKAQHIANIHNSLNHQSVQQSASFVVSAVQEKNIQSSEAEQSQTDKVLPAQGDMDEQKTDTNEVETIEMLQPQFVMLSDREEKIIKCPKCNGDLVLRTATRGSHIGNQFYGCSNYPKCKYIQHLK